MDNVITKQVFFGITVFGMNNIKTSELKRELNDLIEGQAKRHDYEVCCFDYKVEDITDELEKEEKQDNEVASNIAS